MALAAGIAGAIIIFGGILGGYIFTDSVTLTPDTWKVYFFYRFLLHAAGILPFAVFSILISEKKFFVAVLMLCIMGLMNISPILDLFEGPVTLIEPKVYKVVHERFANLSSDVDFSTVKDPYIRLEKDTSYFDVKPEEFQKAINKCRKKVLSRVTGLYHIDRLLGWECSRE